MCRNQKSSIHTGWRCLQWESPPLFPSAAASACCVKHCFATVVSICWAASCRCNVKQRLAHCVWTRGCGKLRLEWIGPWPWLTSNSFSLPLRISISFLAAPSSSARVELSFTVSRNCSSSFSLCSRLSRLHCTPLCSSRTFGLQEHKHSRLAVAKLWDLRVQGYSFLTVQFLIISQHPIVEQAHPGARGSIVGFLRLPPECPWLLST